MDGFQALILVCLATMPADQCNEDNAVDVLSIPVANEIGCTTGWQDVIARGSLAPETGKDTYIRTICRRVNDADKARQ